MATGLHGTGAMASKTSGKARTRYDWFLKAVLRRFGCDLAAWLGEGSRPRSCSARRFVWEGGPSSWSIDTSRPATLFLDRR